MNKIVFLGTSASIPTKTRNLPSIYVKYKEYDILFDCGEGTQRQMILKKISPLKIDIICISHEHADHYLGIYGLIQTMDLLNREKELTIITPFDLKIKVNNFKINQILIKNGEKIEFKGFYILPFKVKHGDNSYGFIFKEEDQIVMDKEKLKKIGLYGKKECGILKKEGVINYNGKTIKLEEISRLKRGIKITYTGDTAQCDNIVKYGSNSDYLIHDCTFIEKEILEKEKVEHCCIKEACTNAIKSRSKNLILFHISPRYEKERDKILKEGRKYFDKVILSEDFMEINF